MSRDASPLDCMPAPEILTEQMTAWRRAHPRATFAEMEGEPAGRWRLCAPS